MNNIEELLEFEGCTPRKHCDQFLCNQVRNSTGECIFLKDSHRLTTITQICLYAAQFSLKRAGTERVEMTHLKTLILVVISYCYGRPLIDQTSDGAVQWSNGV